MPQSIHFISIGGSAMHNLALAMQRQGYIVTGSDVEIYDPSKTRLQRNGLLPAELGWFPEKINSNLNAVIVGMHAKKDNPELTKALELGLPVYSYPEFIYQLSQQKQRIVIAGSHGKTTITAIILHVLNYHNRLFDFWIGDAIDEFDSTVELSSGYSASSAPIIIIEADEYASSPIDSRPKFLHYKPHIALISGIAWEHVNTYPTWDQYVDQFELLAEAMPKAGILIFDQSDDMLDVIGQKERPDITKIPYEAHPSEIVDGKTWLITKQRNKVPVQIFGEHNMKNIAGALTVCDRIGITEDLFYEAIPSFKGVAQRLEKIATKGVKIIYRDFAQSPAKVEAATTAVKHQFLNKKLLTVLELASLDDINQTFIEQYRESLNSADVAIIYYASSTDLTSPKAISAVFDKPNLQVFTKIEDLQNYIMQQCKDVEIFLFMSSDSFSGLDLRSIVSYLN